MCKQGANLLDHTCDKGAQVLVHSRMLNPSVRVTEWAGEYATWLDCFRAGPGGLGAWRPDSGLSLPACLPVL